ncbi:4'-phosphopantetheinyl transferase family protein [Lentisalinibacter orientalis]|uniref:4'-phosphopantetheinyl transferase family protein n=1 Tax=Lentisalinibacter orientalis TaxID=2992241 RepID=UPI0038631BFB
MTRSIESVHTRSLETAFGPEVSAWWISLDAHAESMDRSGLSADEILRSEQMTRTLDARRFLASRHALRCLLASYLDWNRDDIHYQQADRAKPTLVNSNIDFSLSRSQGHALVAIAEDQSVGIDVEVLRPVPERDSLVESLFGEAEKPAVEKAPAAQKDEIFLRTWVRKEACLKSTGHGLRVPLAHVTVGTNACSTGIRLHANESAWQIEVVSLALPAPVVAALAIGRRTA